MLILPSELEESATQDTIDRVRGFISAHGGEVEAFEVWGRRRLSYPIRHHRDGIFHLARFTLGPDEAPELDRTLQRNEQVLRHLMVRVD
ncbi:MAG: 30S ribosomal protein S6 [Chloroflexi bacterium]|nr:30S ribosomal protein S6 [Chloroflexota bacterium]